MGKSSQQNTASVENMHSLYTKGDKIVYRNRLLSNSINSNFMGGIYGTNT